MELEAVIFEGGLADTERDGHRPAFNAAFAEVGFDWRWNDVLFGELLAVTRGKQRMRAFAQWHDPDFWRDPGACLALEDYANGLAASLGAGIVTVVLVSEYTRDQEFSGAVAVLSDLADAEAPCRVLAGDACEHGLVDVDLLRRWRHLGSIPASGGCH